MHVFLLLYIWFIRDTSAIAVIQEFEDIPVRRYYIFTQHNFKIYRKFFLIFIFPFQSITTTTVKWRIQRIFKRMTSQHCPTILPMKKSNSTSIPVLEYTFAGHWSSLATENMDTVFATIEMERKSESVRIKFKGKWGI